MPSSDLSHWLLLAQRLFHDLVALLCVPSTRFGHLFPPAGSPAFLWPSYSHLSRVPNLMGRDMPSAFRPHRVPGVASVCTLYRKYGGCRRSCPALKTGKRFTCVEVM